VPRTTLQEKLAEQLGFLKSSLRRFTEGHPEEALRVATAIRVLVHETNLSNPLLGQIDANYLNLSIRDRPAPRPSRPGGIILFYIGVGVQLSADKGAQPIIESAGPMPQAMSLREWWNKCLLIFPGDKNRRVVFTRKDLLLILSNKEGGAHVDADVPSGYEKFVVDSPLKFIVNGVPTDTVHLARYASIESAAQMIESLEHNFPWLK
jgi:hypothetical protein